MGRRLTFYNQRVPVGAQTINGTAQPGFYDATLAVITLDVTAAGTDVGDTLDVYVDTSVDGGTVWVNVVHFTQLLGTGGAKRETVVINPYGTTVTAPVNTAADLASGAVRQIIGDTWRHRIVQVDADSDAAYTITLKMNLFG